MNNSVFVIVPARNSDRVRDKISELERLGVPYIIICGQPFDHQHVVFRQIKGKWDAINFGTSFIPPLTDLVALNDVDTRIHNWNCLIDSNVIADLSYCDVKVNEGPQNKFYRILNPIRSKFHIAASGELMLIKRRILDILTPLPPCAAEDSYILFKMLQMGYKVRFVSNAYVTTNRTTTPKEEFLYKTRTTLGIYQALNYAKPTPFIRAFYRLLPLIAPLLALGGKDGRAWYHGILTAVRASITKNYSTKF